MNRRTLLGLFPGVVAVVASTSMVPALAADAKSANGFIEIASAWARLNGPTERTVYLEIINHGTNDDRLIGVSAAQAEKCVLEKTQWKGLNVKTVSVAELPVPAMSRTQLKPGGVYIHALGVDASAENKASFPVTLVFANSGQMDVTAEISVRKLGPAH